MKQFLFVFTMLLPFSCFPQEDWTWWNELHGWQPGMPSWRMFLTISPGFLGPNALPVPELKQGILPAQKEMEFGTDFHFMEGDHTQDIAGRFYYPFAGAKIAIEVYGVLLEHYAMSEAIRDERVARDKDARGLAIGDLYFSTLLQLIKNRRFPDTMMRLACKTASGGRLDAARYADSPGYFLDLNFSKNLSSDSQDTQWVPFGMLGFYSWQTNDDMNLQNDALLYGAGIDIRFNRLTVRNSLSGYYGYKNNGDRPMVYTFDLQKELKNYTFRIRYLHGLHDWMYRTVKLSLIWKWD
ncbi:MAG: hypothetical protein RBS73_11490 [Prolixibacteraceae bacterium]|jgi:hypothetical protein|nr:hypothetical protein [Prolixibacteraceae bacterium]